jgi:DNA-binding PadR family transcriptional regulator
MFGFHKRGGEGRGGRSMRFGGGFGGGFEEGGFGGRPGRGGGHGGRGGGGGGRRGKRFEGEELRLLVLGLLQQEAQHGYQLIRAFAEKSGGAYQPSPGVLYPMLSLLEDLGLIAEDASEGSRRSYRLTEAGVGELTQKRELFDLLLARLAALAELAGRTDAVPVRRAVHNMRSAIVERLAREGASPDLAFDVAKIIDEATQKIERL